jgi:hypothetical protein
MSRKPKTSRERVLAYVEKATAGVTPIDVAKATGIEHANARQLLRRMTMARDIQHRYGSYYPAPNVTAQPSGSDVRYVESTVGKCLKSLELEHYDPQSIARCALEEILNFMVRTLGADWTRSQIKKFNSGLEAKLVELDKEYWSDEED